MFVFSFYDLFGLIFKCTVYFLSIYFNLNVVSELNSF